MESQTNIGQNPSYADPAPPWHCQAEVHWFVLYNSTSNPKPVPAGAYHKSDYAPNLTTDSNDICTFKGDLGLVQLIRYSSTPLGPYDELIYTPGKYTAPGDPQGTKSYTRCSRLYVSIESTMRIGRKNFNAPKHLADFEFTANTVKVSLPGKNDTPFFVASWRPMLWGIGIPMDMRWLPLDTNLIQPPLQNVGEEEGCGPAEHWVKYNPRLKGTMSLESVELVEGIGGTEFPDMGKCGIWSVGIKWANANFVFEKGTIVR